MQIAEEKTSLSKTAGQAISTHTQQVLKPGQILFPPFRLDAANQQLWRDKKTISLRPKAFAVLQYLSERPQQLVRKDALLDAVWPETCVSDAALKVCIREIREALGDDSTAPQFIETAHRRGYRFIGTVQIADVEPEEELQRLQDSEDVGKTSRVDATDEKETIEQITTAQESKERRRTAYIQEYKRLALLPLFVLVITVSGFGYFISPWKSSVEPAAAKPRQLAILPFRSFKPDPETDFLGFSLADAIITRLGNVRALTLRPSSYVAKYRNQEIDLLKVADELNVDTLLSGTFFKDGDDLRITVQLIDVKANEILWQEVMDLKYEKLMTVQDRVAQQVIKGLHLNLTPVEAERLNHDSPQNRLAYENYLLGRFLISTNNHSKAIKILEKSVAIDPGYALAWAYLGKAYSVSASQYFGGREYHSKAQAAYEQAEALNPEQLETRILIANFMIENNRVEEAVPLLRAVLADNPNHPVAHWQLSYAYRYAGMLSESIDEGKRALQHYPDIKGHVFNAYLYVGQYQEFINSLPTMEDAYPVFYRGLASFYLHDWVKAATAFDRAYELDPSTEISQIGKALSLHSDKRNREGIKLLKGVEERAEKGVVGDGEITYKLAQAYALLGDTEAALRSLRRSIEQGFFCYPYFVNDPLIKNLRSGNEYAKLMEIASRRHEEFKRRFPVAVDKRGAM